MTMMVWRVGKLTDLYLKEGMVVTDINRHTLGMGVVLKSIPLHFSIVWDSGLVYKALKAETEWVLFDLIRVMGDKELFAFKLKHLDKVETF